MRALFGTAIVAAGLLAGTSSGAVAAPVAGHPDYVVLYNAVFSACTTPAATVDACRAAIDAYAARLIADGVPLEQATASFVAVRAEVLAAGGGAAPFQIDVAALFEELLPEAGAVGPVISPS